MAVFPEAFTQEQKKASYEYYNPYTIHDSSNSICHNQMLSANKVIWKGSQASVTVKPGELSLFNLSDGDVDFYVKGKKFTTVPEIVARVEY